MRLARTRSFAACALLLTLAPTILAQPEPSSETFAPRTFRYLALPRFGDGDSPGAFPIIMLDAGVVVPGHGPLFDRINGGVSSGVNIGIPIGPIRTTPAGGLSQWNASAGFRHFWLDGRDDVQLNQIGGQDFDIRDVNLYMAEFAAKYAYEVPLARVADRFAPNGPFFGGSSLLLGAEVRGRIGGAAADVEQSRFDPTKQQLIIQGGPRDTGLVGGYEVLGKVGLRLRNGVELEAFSGYGQLFTGVLQDRSTGNGFIPIGASISIPLQRRPNTSYYAVVPR